MLAAEPNPARQRGDAERGIGRATGKFARVIARIMVKDGEGLRWRGATHERVERRGV
jgi:hypothetical protein